MCPNSSNGQHNYVLQSVTVDGHVVVRRVCMLCNQEG
jgi:hypothetical protein